MLCLWPILFQALAYKKIGKLEKWKELINKLIESGKNALKSKLQIDFFAVSFPDNIVFNTNLDNLNKVHSNYLQALGFLGKGDKEKTKWYIEKMLEIDANNSKAHLFKNYLIKWII